jgi:hypothetical protein
LTKFNYFLSFLLISFYTYINQKLEKMRIETIKVNIGATRNSQKEQGFFDGRFVSRTEKSKKEYDRKQKHKSKGWE